MANLYGPRIVTDGLVLHLDAGNRKSYPGSGSTWYNLASNTYNAIHVNTVYNSDVPSNFYYNGNYSTGYYSYVNEQDFIQDTSFSISAWIKTTDGARAGGSAGSQGRMVVNTYDYLGAGGDTGWNLGTVWVGTYFRFSVYDGLGAATSAISPESNWYATYLNQWTHVVGVFKSGDYVRLYQDGVLVDDQSTAITTIYSHNDRLFIGRRSAEGQSHWLGNIAIVSYFNRWLKEDEVLQNYNALKGRFGL